MKACICNTYNCNDGSRYSGQGDSDKNDYNQTSRVTYCWSLILLLSALKFDVYFN